MSEHKISRRQLLKGLGLAAAGTALAACQPKVVEKVVKETVEVEKVVEKEVEKQVEVTRMVEADKAEVRFANDPSPEELQLMVPLMDAFQDDTGIRIKLEPTPGGTDQLIAGFAAGTAPDVYGNWGPGMRKLIEMGTCLNLEPFIEVDWTQETLDDFVESQIISGTFEGKRWAVPQYCGIWAGMFNKDLFDEAGLDYPDRETWSYDQYLAAAQKLTKRDSAGIPSQMGTDEWFGFEFTISTNIWTFDGECHDPDDNRICLLHEDNAMDAVQWLADFRWKHQVAATSAESAALKTAHEGFGLFPSGIVGMKPEGSWGVKGYFGGVADRFDWGIMPHHRGPGGNRVTFSTTDMYMANAKTEIPDAAWQWLDYLSGVDYQRMRIQIGRQPCRKSIAQEWVDWATVKAKEINPDADQDFQIFIDGFEYCKPMVYYANHTDAKEIIGPAMDQIFATGEAQAREILPEVSEKVTALLTGA